VTRLTVSMPMLNTPLSDLPAMAQLAEDAKFDGVWSYALIADGPKVLEHVTSDRLVEAFGIVGTPDECRNQAKVYQDLLPNRTLLLHTPYVPPLTREESADALRGIVEAFGRKERVGSQ